MTNKALGEREAAATVMEPCRHSFTAPPAPVLPSPQGKITVSALLDQVALQLFPCPPGRVFLVCQYPLQEAAHNFPEVQGPQRENNCPRQHQAGHYNKVPSVSLSPANISH